MGDRLRNGPRAANFLKKHDHRASLPSNANKIPGMAPPIAAWTHLWHSRKQTGPYGCAVDVAFPSKKCNTCRRCQWADQRPFRSGLGYEAQGLVDANGALLPPARSAAHTCHQHRPPLRKCVLRRRPQGPFKKPIDKPSATNADTHLGLTAKPAALKVAPTCKAFWMTMLVVLLFPLLVPELLKTDLIPFLHGG